MLAVDVVDVRVVDVEEDEEVVVEVDLVVWEETIEAGLTWTEDVPWLPRFAASPP